MQNNPYKPIPAKLLDVRDETSNIKTFLLQPEEPFVFKTGQFVQLTLPGVGEAPFTPSSDPDDKSKLELTIMKAGRVTSELHNIKPGARLGLRGPYGKGYPLDDFKDNEILIVGGGVGLAPLRSLIFALFNKIDNYKKILLRYGARTSSDILYKKFISEWSKKEKVNIVTTVDVGSLDWNGNVGLVTTILRDLPLDLNNAVSIVCGPPIMMKFVVLKLLGLGFKPSQIYLSMERNMSCGFGQCGHCRCGKYYICKDGPVMRFEEIQDIVEDIWA